MSVYETENYLRELAKKRFTHVEGVPQSELSIDAVQWHSRTDSCHLQSVLAYSGSFPGPFDQRGFLLGNWLVLSNLSI